MPVTGRTRLAAVIGDPVRHSRSPALHNAAYAATGLDWVYVALEVGEGEVPSALAGMRSLGLAGLNVTMPHKQAVADAVDVLTPDAQALDAVNTVVPVEGRLVGHNTDGPGFLDSLVDAGVAVAGRRAVVLGAGGAGRAVVRALAGAGAAEVVVVNRTPAAGERAAALAGGAGRLGTELDVAEADLVVNATPLGMGVRAGVQPLPCDPRRLHAGQVVVDLIYDPPETAWMAAAAALGATTVGGLGMLVHQAARAFTLWTGVEAPIEAMRTAALAPR